MKSLFMFIGLFSVSAFAGDMDFSGYFRGPFGNNLSGGKEIQLINSTGNSWDNEFRLGNETPYGELNFDAHMSKMLPSDFGPHVLDAKFTFAINPPFNTQYGDAAPQSDSQVIQAYLVAQWDSPIKWWAGKRFYRWGYVVMDDFFYFADMSGVGIGAEGLPVSKGKLDVALLQFSDSTVQSSIGTPSKDALDVRWGGLPIDDKNNWDLWGVIAVTSPGKGTQTVNNVATPVDFKSGKGFALGARWNRALSGGTNELSAQYGNGVMQSLNLNRDAIAPSDNTNRENRIRLVNNLNTDIDSKWSIRSGLIYEIWDEGDTSHSKQRWSSIGFRPSYQVDKYLQWLFELGVSSITNDAEHSSARQLNRVTVGPQWGFRPGLAANPVLRATLSYTSWSKSNDDATNTNSLLSQYLVNNPNSTVLTDVDHIMQAGIELEMSW